MIFHSINTIAAIHWGNKFEQQNEIKFVCQAIKTTRSLTCKRSLQIVQNI